MNGNLLAQATAYGYEIIVCILLKAVADPKQLLGKMRTSPLAIAIKCGREVICRLLCGSRAKITEDRWEHHDGLAIAAKSGNVGIVQVLLDIGVEPTADALAAAANSKFDDCVRRMLELQASANGKK